MTTLEIVRSFMQLGVPVGIISWLLFDRLYTSGRIDRNADRHTIRADLKRIKKESRRDRSRYRVDGEFFQRRWMKFGGGFYGAAALWTFIAIEAVDLAQFVVNFPGLTTLFSGGVIPLLFNIFINQLRNFVQAMAWFIWWPDEQNSIVPWILTSYLGYLAGISLARISSPSSLVRRLLASRRPER